MRFSIPAAALATLAVAHSASAIITSMSASKTPVKAGDSVAVTFNCTGSLTNNEQDYAIFGLTTPDRTPPVGKTIGSQAIARQDISSYPKNNYRTPFTIEVPIPESAKSGEALLTTAIFGQIGASGGITVQYFNSTINVA
ncbi:hypothetical protein FA10DRAFT_267634 [Acaromyces ingoldii]|uniref:Uncharacterized protein n=1 Tax=Acaromyces ingoldii TaxID=215250 RepID=A0A316YIM2_9BASI|nr:hypothetical protein FA10DRAFT_267634 [Acaromyces ingoldii]PWN89032.1 hypothetical protein FA10DRAFT_267634 [Acaromyces ingoldii]